MIRLEMQNTPLFLVTKRRGVSIQNQRIGGFLYLSRSNFLALDFRGPSIVRLIVFTLWKESKT